MESTAGSARTRVCAMFGVSAILWSCSSRNVCSEDEVLQRGTCVATLEEAPALRLESAEPEDGEESVERSTPITLRFSDAVDAASITPDSVKLTRQADGVQVPVAFRVEGAVVTVTPQVPLHLYAEHVLEVDDAVVGAWWQLHLRARHATGQPSLAARFCIRTTAAGLSGSG